MLPDMNILLFAFLRLVIAVPANNAKRDVAPTVLIPSPRATIIGKTAYAVESFRGIPFAQPPIAKLRLKPPRPLTTALGRVDGTGTPQACPQFDHNLDPNDFPEEARETLTNIGVFANFTDYGEDCLTIDVQRPTRTPGTPSSKLPVLFWIYGGGFQIGATQFYDGTALIRESVSQGKPIIFVSVNYRVGAFGFLAGKELLADKSTNLGLLDQRLGLQWVADNIAAFGGDPNKVTIWGESAGSASVLSHMLLYNGDNTYKGKPLFRAGIMNSGSVVPAERADSARAQEVYNTVSHI
jgi:carboxylesterase type B